MNSSSGWGKLAAVFYFIWGLLHLQAAYSVYELGKTLPDGMRRGGSFKGPGTSCSSPSQP